MRRGPQRGSAVAGPPAEDEGRVLAAAQPLIPSDRLGHATLRRASGPEHFMNLSYLERDIVGFPVLDFGQRPALRNFICGWAPPAKDVELIFGEMVGCSHMSGPGVRYL